MMLAYKEFRETSYYINVY